MKKKIVALIVLFLFTLFVLRPFARPGFYVSDDGDWMIIRLSAFYQSLREGQMPVRFLGRLNQSYGYPVSNFLYPGYLYVGSFIHATGLPFVQTVKLLLCLSVLATGLGSFFWLLTFFSPFSSLIGSISIVGSTYLLFDLYKRGSVGEILAIAVFSWVLFFWERKKWTTTTLLIGFLILSHNTLALLFIGFLVLYSIFRERPKGVLPIIGGIAIASFFWIPAIIERKYVVFDHTAISDATQYFISKVGWSLANWVFIGAGILSIFLTKPSKLRLFCTILFCLVLFLITPVSWFLWGKGVLTTFVQFPYRLLSISLFTGAFLVSLVSDSLLSLHRYILGFVIVLFLCVEVHSFTAAVTPTNKPESFYTTNEATTTVAGEYMPIWVREPAPERANNRLEFFSGRGTQSLSIQSTQKVAGTIIAEEDSIVQLNSVYYPGWGVVIDGIPSVIRYDNPRGVIRVSVPKGTHSFLAEFHETLFRFIVDCLSFVSLFVILLLASPCLKYCIRMVVFIFSGHNHKKISRKKST
jgi:hypothetical protein